MFPLDELEPDFYTFESQAFALITLHGAVYHCC
jgi:hypothetical protein